MNRRDGERTDDILSAIDRIAAYRSSLRSADALIAGMAYDAVLRNLAVIGEAVRALPAEFKAARPNVPWPAIAGLRNILVHEYFRVDPEVVTDIIDTELVALTAELAPRSDGGTRG